MSATELVTLEANQFKEQQLSRWQYEYTLNVLVPCGQTFPAILPVEEDADFLITYLTISAFGPVDDNGIKALNATTNFPLAGTSVPSGAGLPAIADRGLMVKITDQGAGRTLTNGYVALETIASPGYGISRTLPQPFRYYVLRNSKLEFDIRNRDNGDPALYHYCSITLGGFKYNTPREG